MSNITETEQAPVFHHAEILELYQLDWNFPQVKIDHFLALPRQTLIADLETVIKDSIIRYDVFKKIENEANNVLIHAIWLLCELKAEESLPTVLDMLRQNRDWLDFWFNDLIHEMLPMNFWFLGVNQSEKLFGFLREERKDWGPRSVVSVALSHIARHHPNKRAEIVTGYKEFIDFCLENEDNYDISDPDFLGGLAVDLHTLKDLELLPYVKKLYDADLIPLGISGIWTDYERDFLNPQNMRETYFTRKNMGEYYAEIRALIAKNEEEDRKWQEKRAIEASKKTINPQKLRSSLPIQNGFRPNVKDNMPKKVKDDTSKMDIKKLTQNVATPRNAPCPCGSGRKYKNCHDK